MLERFGFDPAVAVDVTPRRNRMPDVELAELAKVYAHADSVDEPPRLAVAKERCCSPSYASKLVRKMRDRGLLTDSGRLTPKARRLLDTDPA